MAHLASENIHASIFTPKEYQVELLATALNTNVIICLTNRASQSFVALMLLKEHAAQLRDSSLFCDNKTIKRISIFLTSSSELATQEGLFLSRMTDLNVRICHEFLDSYDEPFDCCDVLVLTISSFLNLLKDKLLDPQQINLLIVDDCYKAVEGHPLYQVMEFFDCYKSCQNTKILGLAPSILNYTCEPHEVEECIIQLEETLGCQAETASEITSILRFSSKCKEFIVNYCDAEPKESLTLELLDIVNSAKEFLADHQYDLTMTYGDEFQDIISEIPDPTQEPLLIFSDFLFILNSLGPICADMAALQFLFETEKLKKKTPHERHYLLLCIVFTTMLKIRATYDYHVESMSIEEKLLNYTSPKLKRLIEIIDHFKVASSSCEVSLDSESSPCQENFPNRCFSHEYETQNCCASNFTMPYDLMNIEYCSNECNLNGDCTSCMGKHNIAVNGHVHVTLPSNGNLNEAISTEETVNNENEVIESNNPVLKIEENDSNSERLLDSSPQTTNEDLKIAELKTNHEKTLQPEKTTMKSTREFLSGKNKFNLRDDEKKIPAYNIDDPSSLCGIIFVEKRCTAKILYYFFKELSKHDKNYRFISPQYAVGPVIRQDMDSKEIEMEHRKQEEVLRRFRMRECNLLISTNILEEGVDIPKCNLVVRFDPPCNFISYVQSKGRARSNDSYYVIMVLKDKMDKVLDCLASYRCLQNILLSKCHHYEVPTDEEVDPFESNSYYTPYSPTENSSVSMSSAISLLNRYCARLPSDTFTRLTPIWKITEYIDNDSLKFSCEVQLPINSPVKECIKGPFMNNTALAKMAAALKTCVILHKYGELDDNLQPIGKETIKWQYPDLIDSEEEKLLEGFPRPGTTKRRQYYYKKVSDAIKWCVPSAGQNLLVYKIHMVLTYPIPDEQNIRGRQIYAPESSSRSFAILTSKVIPTICAFPIFTRSGEVSVKLTLISDRVCLSKMQLDRLKCFHNYTFSKVLRLDKYPMVFDVDKSECTYLIVPLIADELKGNDALDWEFVNMIHARQSINPKTLSDEERKNFNFDVTQYEDAVVMPWYRNQDQPQHFYVAEICHNLSPTSDFPDAGFETFEKYYLKKYNIQIQNLQQCLLDVDLTSARLNLLTPRYVNRKGVALPTCSEETKKAKRENLRQKVILVPELCSIHPFPASLWRKAVCLPCILYRINCLLISDQLRKLVASEIDLGSLHLPVNHEWPPLDFGWNLADVLKKRNEKLNKMKCELLSENSSIQKSQISSDSGVHSIDSINSGVNNNNSTSIENESLRTSNRNFEKEVYLGKLKISSHNFDLSQSNNGDILSSNDGVLEESLLKLDIVGITELEDNSFNRNNKLVPLDLCSESTDPSVTKLELDAKEELEDAVQMTKTILDKEVIKGMMQIGTWSNDMSSYEPVDFELDVLDPNLMALPTNLMVLTSRIESEPGNAKTYGWPVNKNDSKVRYGSPSNFDDKSWDDMIDGDLYGFSDGHSNFSDTEFLDSDGEDGSYNDENCGVKIEFISDNIAEAIETATANDNTALTWAQTTNDFEWNTENKELLNDLLSKHSHEIVAIKDFLMNSAMFVKWDEKLDLKVPWHLPEIDNSEPQQSCDSQASSPHVCYEEWVVEKKIPLFNPPNIIQYFSPVPNFDAQPNLDSHPGPSPSIILTALTMSNANDGINLERLETIGDSFLKYAITAYLYCVYPYIHEGKLSYLRSKQVSNLNLYRLGRRKGLGELMVATKFEPHENWLPPGYYVPKELEQALIESGVPTTHWNMAELPDFRVLPLEDIKRVVQQKSEQILSRQSTDLQIESSPSDNPCDLPCFIPYNLLTQHSIPDKSIADCVEALIGAYLISCGPRGALLFMSWLGLQVLPKLDSDRNNFDEKLFYGDLWQPPSPLLFDNFEAHNSLENLLSGYEKFEALINYKFKDRSYLLQAFTHASYYLNRISDCYQRLEFLGDAVLDYLITRHLYDDKRQHSPGALTDLRSALVNNTIFASLAVKYDFHKYFKHFSPGLGMVIEKFVAMQIENGHKINEEYYFMEEEECEEAEDIEVPKALGDVFESVAGAIFLDSGRSLDAVWTVYYEMMKSEIEQFSANVPKSPIRELLEMEPETAKFGKPERLLDGKRVRVTVEIFGKGTYRGIGRNYRIAKSTAAKCALRALKKQKHNSRH